MKKIICPIHDISIVIYEKVDEYLFIDDDRKEVSIFHDDNGKKYLKRFSMISCNENCETIKNILEEN